MAIDESLEQTAISSDRVGSAPAVAPGALALAETHLSAQGSIVRDMTLRSDSPQVSAGPLPGQIGRYLVIRSIAAGGMGEVVEAFDPELDRRVALKLLKTGRGGDDSQARLLREAQAMARLSHANVVQIHDVGVQDDRVFLAMELVVGETLTRWLATPRSWREVVRVFVAAARGLAAAHRAGLVHRDFKPDNVLMGADGQPRVADFGLAREDRPALAEAASNPGEVGLLADRLTATGVVMGTPMYMSPEQHLGLPAGPASDIFSFSVALFEALHGARPFAGDTMPVLARNVTMGVMEAPTGKRAVPGWLDAAVRRGLAVDAGERYPDFERMIAAIDRDPGRTRGRWLTGLGLGVAAGAFGAVLQGQAKAEVCGGGQAAIAEIWGAEVEGKLRERLGPDAAGRVVAGVQAYADGWVTMHGEACREHQRGESSAALFDARTRCLEQRRQGLGEALGLFVAGDGGALREASMVVAKLPALAPCADVAALTAEVAPPEDPAVAAEVEGLREQLVRARVVATAGRSRDALTMAEGVGVAAERLEYRPLLAEARLLVGRVAIESQQLEVAGTALAQAHVVATAAGHDHVAAEAKARLMYVEGMYFGRVDAVLGERALAEAWVTRLGRRPGLEALLANNIGLVLRHHGDQAEARERFTTALRLSAEDPARDPIDHARGYLANTASVTTDPTERARLFDEAVVSLEQRLGPEHGELLMLRLNRALYTHAPEQAQTQLAALCPVMLAGRAEGYVACTYCYRGLAHVEDELGHVEAAVQAMAMVGSCLDAPGPAADEAMVAEKALADGYRALWAGDVEAARGEFVRAEGLWQPVAEQWWAAPIVADLQLGRARALVALGRGEEAAALLEQAIVVWTRTASRDMYSFPRYGLARAQSTLAEVLWARAAVPGAVDAEATRTRALGLLAAAEGFYREAGAGYEERLAELGRWRAAHGAAGP
jgi:tetratricopeptide (TPR) repeat protein